MECKKYYCICRKCKRHDGLINCKYLTYEMCRDGVKHCDHFSMKKEPNLVTRIISKTKVEFVHCKMLVIVYKIELQTALKKAKEKIKHE